jgi:hypothetical protein
MNTAHELILLGGVLGLISIFAGVIGSRFNAPLLLIFLVLGMVAGEDGPVRIQFADFGAAYLIGSIALAIILFEGGLKTERRMIRIASSLASRNGRATGSYEFQMLYGIRPEEQRRLAAAGETVRVYVPYGTEWYGYLMRRLAERPQNLTFFVRSLISKK